MSIARAVLWPVLQDIPLREATHRLGPCGCVGLTIPSRTSTQCEIPSRPGACNCDLIMDQLNELRRAAHIVAKLLQSRVDMLQHTD